jgi:hypothetical protein
LAPAGSGVTVTPAPGGPCGPVVPLHTKNVSYLTVTLMPPAEQFSPAGSCSTFTPSQPCEDFS